MPIYEYRCQKCNTKFEKIFLPQERQDNIACPACGSSDVKKQLSPAGIRPKGIPKGKGGFKVPECMNRERKI